MTVMQFCSIASFRGMATTPPVNDPIQIAGRFGRNDNQHLSIAALQKNTTVVG